MSICWQIDKTTGVKHRFEWPIEEGSIIHRVWGKGPTWCNGHRKASCGRGIDPEDRSEPTEPPTQDEMARMWANDQTCSECMEIEVYPEHAKMRAVGEMRRDAVGDFVQWLSEQGLAICRWRDDLTEEFRGRTIRRVPRYLPVGGGPHDWVAQHFGIDLQKLGAEKRRMLTVISDAARRDKNADPTVE